MTTDSIPYKAQPQRGLSLHYYDESPLAGSPYYHPEVAYRPSGVAGELLPYTVSRDDVITGALLLCFVIAAVSVAFSRNFIARHLRSLFYVKRSDSDILETSSEVRFQLVLCLQTALLMALVFQLYTRFTDGDEPMADSQVVPLAAFWGVNVAYLLAKWLIHQLVDHTFFTKRQIGQMMQVRLFLTSTIGVLLFPVVLVQIYLGLPLIVTLIYTLFIVILVKIMTIYKAQTIFFKSAGDFVQNILYFCTLEMMPLCALWGVLTIVQHYLKVIF